MKHLMMSLLFPFLFLGCGAGSSDSESSSSDSIYNIEYKGLQFYAPNMSSTKYTLTPLSQTDFDNLSVQDKYVVSDKLLSTLFFGMSKADLEKRFESNDFINYVQDAIKTDKQDRASLEEYIIDEEYFSVNSSNAEEAVVILNRFYAMEELDRYFFINWSAYILTQTIMFSPSYELESSHDPNIARVYNRLVTMLDDEATMSYTTYLHMMSDDNWRRFRSPEDNGREMLEIYALDQNDSHVPIAAKALQNWSLDRDNDTLVIGLNENTSDLDLFGTTIINGEDFYRELAISNEFSIGVITRLVDFFFSNYSADKQTSIAQDILKSKPKTWQDVLQQIIFSKEYLLKATTPKSAEEVFFSLVKKMEYKHRRNTIYYFKEALTNMNQASMKYKLGKLTRVPLDTLSFAFYHKYIREEVLLRRSNPNKIDDYDHWSRQGWSDSFIANENFKYDYTDEVGSLHSLINYLFISLVNREATTEELAMFTEHVRYTNDQGEEYFHSHFDIFSSKEARENYKRTIVLIVMDYISRLDELYVYKGVSDE